MVYATDEVSPQSGAPIECYKFIGSYASYYYTSYQEAVTVDGQLYSPIAIKRNAVTLTTQDETQAALEITLPYQNEMIQAYAYEESPPRLDLELYRVHETDYNDSILLWSGRVTAFTVKGFEASLKVPSVFDYALQGIVPTPRYQAPCNHIFTDARCGVAAGTVTETVTVTAVVSNVITVSGMTFTQAELLAGMVTAASGESRMITSVVGSDITVSYPFSNIAVAESADLVKGCDHSFAGGCTTYSNIVNYGGFPVVPNRNPFTGKI